MSNYSKTTDFEAKDSLPTGDSGKIIRGAEFETEFDAISTAIATKADTAGPTFTGTLTFETISDGTIDVTAFVDEDDMSSNSATLVPTQQSVKAYVDSQVTAQDLDFQADSGGALSIDLDSETLTFTGGTGIDTSGSGNAVTFAIDSTVATLTGTQTLTNKTLTSPDVNTPDIDGGTIDGTVIGGTTAAAGSFTTVSATGNITVDGTVDGRDVATDGTKLDGIESGATADQTAAEIRTLVDSATDSNVFTDADHSKLDGIEAGADVTDTANVTAAGALMDSELTSEASVKALNQGVATTDSPTFAGVTVNGTVEFDGLSGTGAVNVTDILDQDDMLSNSATALATQQSIKAYVDSQVATADTLSEVLANGNTTGGTDIAVGTGDDITFADNSKAIFGAGSDLQIYHTGSHSFVQDTGSGDLYLATNGDKIILRNTTLGESFFEGTSNGDAKIFYNGLEKLTTTSAGIDVTGTVTADGLTVDAGTSTEINLPHNGFNYIDFSGAGAALIIRRTGDLPATRWSSNGDINLGYEDTGTTAKLFWDASAESLGIGTSSPSAKLDINGGNITAGIKAVEISGSTSFIADGSHGTSLDISHTYSSNDGSFRAINVDITDAGTNNQTLYGLYVDAEANYFSGNVGIGTSSPAAPLSIAGSSTGEYGALILRNSNSAASGQSTAIIFEASAGTSGDEAASAAKISALRTGGGTTGALLFHTTLNGVSSERLRISSTGSVLAGHTSANFASVGHGLQSNGNAYHTRDGGNPLTVNRKTSDGSVIDIMKDTVSVGSIGTRSSGLVVGSGDTGLFYDGGGDRIFPESPSGGAARDAAIDLGTSAARFKDLYLSGGVVFGTTGGSVSSKTLDDYEEGTYVATLTPSTSGSITLNTIFDTLSYTKVGRIVSIVGRVRVSSVSSPVGTYVRLSLPFNIATGSEDETRVTGSVVIQQAAQDIDKYCMHPKNGTSYIEIGRTDNFASNAANDFNGNELVAVNLTYIAA